ncbi:MAG TPA: YcaO-like family protein, partial [Devosia sp.]|nr:YcaO-like family protein [Devosia sp.]
WPGGQPVYAPYELVGIDYRDMGLWDHESFHMSSIGLAAHARADAALRHALLETIENDATAALEIFGFTPALIEPLPEVAGPYGLGMILRRTAAAGLTVRFCRIVGAVDLPVVGCFVGRDIAGAAGTGTSFSAGFACRLDPGEAALAAVLEALQSRLTDIAGARDDIAAEAFEPAGYDIADDLPPTRVTLAGSTRPSARNELAAIAMCLRQAGIDEVFVFELAHRPSMTVIRVLVPDLQAPGSASQLRLGLTAARQLLR